ncbi:MAG: tripartite tricarboxylate transporter permease [Candidatus Aenigmatarchaeota archaeon]
MFEIFLFFLFGIIAGVIAGIIPGIHPNFIAMVASSLLFSIFPTNIDFLAFIVAMGITNSFISTIPSILLGAPEEESCLAILPGHYFLMKGYGYYAIKLTIVGSLFGFIFCLFILPIVYFIFPLIYTLVRNFIHIVLSFVVLYTILLEKSKRKILLAAFIFLISGIVGILGNNLPINQNFYLFVALSGLFGMPNLLISIKRSQALPKQKIKERRISIRTLKEAIARGSLAGFITGLLPGVGASQATMIATLGKASREYFLLSLGAATTSNVFFSFLALWLIGKPRSGLAIAVKNFIKYIGMEEFLALIIISLVASSLSTIIGLWISKRFLERLAKIDYRKVNLFIVMLLSFLTYLTSSFYGIILLIITTSLGLFALTSKVRRVNLMGFLIFPTILFFSGIYL